MRQKCSLFGTLLIKGCRRRRRAFMGARVLHAQAMKNESNVAAAAAAATFIDLASA